MPTSPVAVPGSEPIREIGSMLSELTGRGGATVIFTCWLAPLAVTVIVAPAACATAEVVTGIDADHAPAGVGYVAGAPAAGGALGRPRETPPAGAGPGRVTPKGAPGPPLAGAGPCRFTQMVAAAPPLTAAGVTWTDWIAAGSTVIWSVTETPLSVAVIVTGVGTATCPSEIWKSVQAWFPGTVIVAGTV